MKKMKKNFSLFSIILFGLIFISICSLFVACDQEIKPKDENENLAKISIAIGEPKLLEANRDLAIASYEITTVCRQIAHPDPLNKVNGVFTNHVIDPNEPFLGYFTQGLWRFHLSAKNANGEVIYECIQNFTITINTSLITLNLQPVLMGIGNIRFNLKAPIVSNPSVNVYSLNNSYSNFDLMLSSNYFTTTPEIVDDQKTGYLLITSNEIPINAGIHNIAVRLYENNKQVAGQLVNIYVSADSTTEITGILENSQSSEFVSVSPNQTISFVQACDLINLYDNEMVIGFFNIETQELVDFPFTNNDDTPVILVPKTSTDILTMTTDTVSGNANIKYLGLPKSIKTLNVNYANSNFKELYALGVTSINAQAFMDSQLTHCKLGSLEFVGARAFKNTNISETPIFDIDTVIEDEAFYNTNIKSVNITRNTILGSSVFAFTDLYYASVECDDIPNNTFDSSSLEKCSLSYTQTIGNRAFANTQLKTILLPVTLRTIGTEAFKDSDLGEVQTDLIIPKTIQSIGQDAFKNTMPANNSIIIDLCSGDLKINDQEDTLVTQPQMAAYWGHACNVYFSSYILSFDGNESSTASSVSFKILANGKIDTLKRKVPYNAPIGANLDNIPIPTPECEGYAFIGWYDNPECEGSVITQETINSKRHNWTLYAKWMEGLVNVFFDGGKNSLDQLGAVAERYRTVPFNNTYNKIYNQSTGEIDTLPLPVATVDGRTFVGWYAVSEPFLASGMPDEVSQQTLTPITNSTIVSNNAPHVLYAHYLDNRYQLNFNLNYSTCPYCGGGIGSWESDGTPIIINPTTECPSCHNTRTTTAYQNQLDAVSRTVVFNHPLSLSFNGTESQEVVFPVLQSSYFLFDNWYNTPDFEAVLSADLIVPALPANTIITAYAKWFGSPRNVSFVSPEKSHPLDANFSIYDKGSKLVRISTDHVPSTFGKSVREDFEHDWHNDFSESLPSPIRTGFTFDGWYTSFIGGQVRGALITNNTTVPTGSNLTLYAKWIPNTYLLTFDYNNATGNNTASSKEVTYFAPYGVLPSPTRRGYSPNGWQVDNTPITSTSYVTTASDHTAVYSWIANTYTVTFDYNTGDEGETTEKIVTFDSPYGLLPSANKTGYSFIGWSDPAENIVTSSSIVNYDRDIILKAQYEANTYPVSFEFNNGITTKSTKQSTFDSPYGSLPSNPVPNQATLLGWFTEETEGVQITEETINTTPAPHSVYAQWEENVDFLFYEQPVQMKTFLRKSLNSNFVKETKTVKFLYPYGNLPIPSRIGYTWNGVWYINDTPITASSIVQQFGHHSATTTWTPNIYTVTFYPLNGNSNIIRQGTFDAPYSTIFPSNPIKSGYNFDGWFDLNDVRINGSDIISTPNNHDLFAKYVAQTYTVTLDSTTNGGSGGQGSINVTFDAEYGLMQNPIAPNGYSFNGWFTSPVNGSKVISSTIVTTPNNHTLYAQYVPNPYIVSFDAKTGSNAPNNKIVTFDSAYGTLNNPTAPAGYEFANWSLNNNIITASTIVKTAQDHTLDALYSPLSYTVTLNSTSNGGSGGKGSMTVTFDSPYGDFGANPTKTGYSFNGWFTTSLNGTKILPSTIVKTASNHTLFAQYVANTYTVSFDAKTGSNAPNNKQVTYDSTYGDLNNPTNPTGYSFVGWFNNDTKIEPTTIVKTPNDHTLDARYSANSYNVTYNYQTGSGSVANKTVVFDSAYGELAAITAPTGYSSIGWFNQASGGSSVLPTTIVKTAQDHTLYAHFNPNAYTVSFNANGGTNAPSSKQVTYDAPYGTLNNPTAPTGYSFTNWKYNDNVVDSSTIVKVADNHTLVASYSPNIYTVSFDALTGSNAPNPKQVTFDSTYGTLNNPTNPIGYTFTNWYSASTGGTPVLASTTVKTAQNHTLFARYNPNTYTVSFNAGAGTNAPSNKQVTYDSTYGTLNNPTAPSGYTFSRWVLNNNTVTSSTTVKTAQDHTLSAVYTANIYTVTLNATENGGSGGVGSINVTYNSTYGNMGANPTKTGYSFAGWYTAKTGGTKIESNTPVTITSNQTLYAQYTPVNYTVTFDASTNGGSCSTSSKVVTYDSTYSSLPTPTKTGYSFTGWHLNSSSGAVITSSTVVKTASNHTLVATFSVNNYTVTYDYTSSHNDHPGPSTGVPSGTPSSNSITYGNKYVLGVATPPLGYQFTGFWNALSGGSKITTDTTMNVASNHTLYARYSPKTYTLTYNYNGATGGNSNATKTVTFDDEYGTLPSPTKTGYTFSAWKDGSSTIINTTRVTKAENHTITANYIANTYKVTFNANGGSVSPAEKNVTYASTYSSLPTPTKYGYNFQAWHLNSTSGTTINSGSTVSTASDHTLYATYTAKTNITVSFNANGGSNAPSSKQVTYDASYGTLNNPTAPSGYTFAGWYTAANGGTLVTSSSTVANENDHILYAHYAPNTITVNFDYNGATGGNSTTSKSYTYNTKYTNLPTPTKTGYKFAGWYSTENRSQGYGYINSPALVTSNTTITNHVNGHYLYAAWISYKIVDTNNNSSSSSTHDPNNSGNYTTNSSRTFKIIEYPYTNGRQSGSSWIDNSMTEISGTTITYSGNNSSNNTISQSGKTITVSPLLPSTTTITIKPTEYTGGSYNYSWTINNTGVLTGLSISGSSSVTVRNTSQYSFAYIPNNTHISQRGVTWSIASSSDPYSSINSNGLFSAGYENVNTTIQIKSTYNSSIINSKVISQTAPSGTYKVKKDEKVNFVDIVGDFITDNQYVTGFKKYDPISPSNSDLFTSDSYRNYSTGHSMWLQPIYKDSVTKSEINIGFPRNISKDRYQKDNSNLISVYFPDSGNLTIEYESFANTTSLKRVAWPNAETVSIDSYAFYNSYGYWLGTSAAHKIVYINNYGCAKVQADGLNLRNCNIGERAFYQSSIKYANIDGWNIGKEAFLECTNLQRVYCNTGTNIGVGAFRGCSSLTKFNYNSSTGQNVISTETIDIEAFNGVPLNAGILNLNEVVNIGANAFNNGRFTKVLINGGVGNAAFANNTALTEAVFGSQCGFIDTDAFAYCSNLSTVDFLAKGNDFKDPNKMVMGTNVWYNCALRNVKLTQGNFALELSRSQVPYSNNGSYAIFYTPYRTYYHANCTYASPVIGYQSRYHCQQFAAAPNATVYLINNLKSPTSGKGNVEMWEGVGPGTQIVSNSEGFSGLSVSWMGRQGKNKGLDNAYQVTLGLGAASIEEYQRYVINENYAFTAKAGGWADNISQMHPDIDNSQYLSFTQMENYCNDAVYPTQINRLIPYSYRKYKAVRYIDNWNYV